MYCKSIFEAIDLIGLQKFENEKIDVILNNNAIFFLASKTKNFVRIYDPNRLSISIGLTLKKTDFNSIDDQVNPEFLQALKKTTQTFLTKLASNWEEDLKVHEHFLYHDPHRVLENCPNLRVKNEEAAHCILHDIAGSWNFSEKIKMEGSIIEVRVCGKPEDLKQFLNILRLEARAAEREPRSLSRIVCSHICSDLSTYQKDERYKFLPKELLEKINKESIFYLTEK